MNLLFTPWRRKYVVEGEGRDDSCVFCRLPDEEERDFLLETEHWYLVLNAYPYCNGHMMLVSRRHLSWLSDLSSEEMMEMPALLARAESALRIAYSPDGMNLGINIGSAAGAGVPGHLHIHLLPRWIGDTNFMTSLGETRILPEEISLTFEKLSKALEEGHG
ncbi:MAG: HIT domain-containing protein [Candidatus Krumholzibacteria bacterium]|jgi:ATP adenylyltransferase|nr:HIT domain-containing protein [Candidatus Krumholzibacteria bacterium]MDP6669216.1 HIT domain-containing protein [Candidatus Krumholzibacteria bacterium]MDP6796459.1 HIT domain-containing protein [Candidatus Krumholzibacteria bacterium]MDP7021589.1 HIT domain-containing protein [Candidatus Krumholzibacteria bacterium]